MTVLFTLITENSEVRYQDKSELTYMNFEGGNISLYINQRYIGEVEIKKNGKGREYIILNHTNVYLEDLTEIF